MIASDIHGSYTYTQALLERFRAEGAQKLLLLGDILYHGPRNDLPDGYQPKKVIEALNAMRDKIYCVRGNCEAEVDQMVLEFPVLADYAVFHIEKAVIYATHGHTLNAKNPPPASAGEILLSGHTHVPKAEEVNGLVCLNPGSVSIPKEMSPRSYMTLENGLFRWKKLESGETYMEYRVQP